VSDLIEYLADIAHASRNHDGEAEALHKAIVEIEQLQERMQKAHNHLINLQPHIPQACYPGHESFIDSHIDEAMKLLSETTKNTDRFGVSEAADALGDKLIREARGEVKTRPLTEKDS